MQLLLCGLVWVGAVASSLKFDNNTNVDLSAGDVDIIDVNTTTGDEGIKYEIVSARGNCKGDAWSDKDDWDAWTMDKFVKSSGYMYANVDDVDAANLPYLEREVTGLSGLTKIELDVDVKGTAYNNNVNYVGKWANLDLYVDGFRYATWENYEEDQPMIMYGFGASINPRIVPIGTSDGPFTTYRIGIPWNGKSNAKLRFEFMANGDDFWVGKIVPRGGAATANCDDTDKAKSLFEIDSKTGELKFKNPPDSNENYGVKVKATNDAGEVGYVTINVTVD